MAWVSKDPQQRGTKPEGQAKTPPPLPIAWIHLVFVGMLGFSAQYGWIRLQGFQLGHTVKYSRDMKPTVQAASEGYAAI